MEASNADTITTNNHPIIVEEKDLVTLDLRGTKRRLSLNVLKKLSESFYQAVLDEHTKNGVVYLDIDDGVFAEILAMVEYKVPVTTRYNPAYLSAVAKKIGFKLSSKISPPSVGSSISSKVSRELRSEFKHIKAEILKASIQTKDQLGEAFHFCLWVDFHRGSIPKVLYDPMQCKLSIVVNYSLHRELKTMSGIDGYLEEFLQDVKLEGYKIKGEVLKSSYSSLSWMLIYSSIEEDEEHDDGQESKLHPLFEEEL